MSTATLLADIGGTNARFALRRDNVTNTPVVIATADFPTLTQALRHTLALLDAPPLDTIAMCAAGPPVNGVIKLTNRQWVVSKTALAAATGARRIVLVNDFTALAAALPALSDCDLHDLGESTARRAVRDSTQSARARAVIGPGTGLGMSACIPAGGDYCIISGEGGHADLAAANREEEVILERLRQRFGHVSAERVLSGAGLLNLYQAMHPDDEPPAPRCAGEIAARAARGDQRALNCVRQFSAWLGAVSGDLALTVGALGGVYLAGGILPAWGAMFPVDIFRERFIAKGRYKNYLAAIPTYLIMAPYPALTGLTQLITRSIHTTEP